MARRKIRLAYIANESKRKASYNKRKKGILKKLNELTVLCNVEAAAIMYSPFEQEPVVWPSVDGVLLTIARFNSLPSVQQTRRMLSNESYLQERINKLSLQVLKLKKDNREKEMTELMFLILAEKQTIDILSSADLNDLGWVINIHLAEIDSRIASTPSPTLAPFLSSAPSLLAPASTSVLGPGTSNLVAPQQHFQGNMGMQTPMISNFNLGMPWDNQNDATRGGPPSGPSGSMNP